MPIVRRSVALVLVLFVLILFSGCGGVNWSVTPYAGVNGNTDDEYYNGVGWQAGVSLTLYSGRYPAPPAVIQPPANYRSDVNVHNNVSSASSSSSNSSANQSQGQNQDQSQSQSQNQDQNQNQPGGGGGGSGGDDDCGHPGHGHGHGHGSGHGPPDHDDDHDD